MSQEILGQGGGKREKVFVLEAIGTQ